MKLITILLLLIPITGNSLPDLSNAVSSLQDMSKDVMDACKDDKKNIKACESYTDTVKLKICFIENKEKLSDKCKKSLKLK